MINKFIEYQKDMENVEKMSQYVHENFKLIMGKMTSEMRRKLNLTADRENIDGYVSLQASLMGRMMNEAVYVLAGYCQSLQMTAKDFLPLSTIMMFLDLIEGKNPLNGSIRKDIFNNPKWFEEFYLPNIEKLREELSALPPD